MLRALSSLSIGSSANVTLVRKAAKTVVATTTLRCGSIAATPLLHSRRGVAATANATAAPSVLASRSSQSLIPSSSYGSRWLNVAENINVPLLRRSTTPPAEPPLALFTPLTGWLAVAAVSSSSRLDAFIGKNSYGRLSFARCCYYSSASSVRLSPLDEFRDPVPRQQRMKEPVGRSWTVTELRRKSYHDLHKLWYVLYKERNMLLTELQLSRRRGLFFPQPERMRKVRKSLGAIRQVLGERKREKIAAFRRERERQQDPQEDHDAEMRFHE